MPSHRIPVDIEENVAHHEVAPRHHAQHFQKPVLRLLHGDPDAARHIGAVRGACQRF